jgi:hypothetical protein
MPKNYAVPMLLRNIDVSTLVDPLLFYPINPMGLEEALLILHFVNLSDIDVFLGFGSENVHEFLPTDGGTFTLEFQVNAEPTSKEFLIKKGTIFYANGDGAQAKGNVYVSGWLRSRD